MIEQKTIVVFGATGNLGAYVVQDLVKSGYHVIPVGKRKSDNGFFESVGADKYLAVDIVKPEDFKNLPKYGVFGIVHLAGALPSRYEYDPSELLSSIITGTLNILEYMKKVGAQRIVFPQTPFDVHYLHYTTIDIDPESFRSFPKTGDHSIYTIAKNTAINLLEHYYATFGIQYYALRFFTIYEYHPNPYHYLNFKCQKMPYRTLIDMAINSETITIWGDPNRTKEIVYIKDFTQVVRKCFETQFSGGIYNVGNKRGISLKEQIETIVDVFSPSNNRSKIINDFSKPSALQAKFDITKTLNELDYVQNYTYLEAMKDFKIDMDTEPFAQLWGVKEDYE